MTIVFTVFAIMSYLTAIILWKRELSSKRALQSVSIVAVLLHAIVLYQNMLTIEGINLGFFNAASLVAWVISLLLLLSLPHKPVENLIIIFFPIAAVTLALATIFDSTRFLSTEIFGVQLHVLSSILAYSLLSLSTFQALFLAMQEYSLRRKRFRWVLRRLPPLKVMEILLFQMIVIGFSLLSISLITGIIFLEDIFAQHLVHKTVLSIAAWIIFAILLWGRWFHGWRGNLAIRWHLSGFIMLMLAYFGSKLVLELILHR
jgi:ABC-type uncharacterized transport system permease subunit